MLKKIQKFIRSFLTTNMVLGVLALPINLPTPPVTLVSQTQSNLLISEKQLDTTFNVNTVTKEENVENDVKPSIQVPLTYIYMSQGYSAFHQGIDLAAKYGEAVKPVTPGFVKTVEYSTFGYGKMVIIDNGEGIETLYAHLSKIEVKEGDVVSLDTKIGLVGTTGHATGPHLHLEVFKGGKNINPITLLPTLPIRPIVAARTTLLGSNH